MKTFLALLVLVCSSSAFASVWDGREILTHVGGVYTKTEGKCAGFVDVMRWFNYDSAGLVSIAMTDRPGVRPLEGYQVSLTINVDELAPTRQGEFFIAANQPVPIKAEYDRLPGDGLSIHLRQKGRGAWASPISGEGGYAGQNRKMDLVFSKKDDNGIYQQLELSYRNKKGLRGKFSKAQVCRYVLKQAR